MAENQKNSLRSSMLMTNEEKIELRDLTKKAKTPEEYRKIKEQFYQKQGIRPARLHEKWEFDAKFYEKQ